PKVVPIKVAQMNGVGYQATSKYQVKLSGTEVSETEMEETGDELNYHAASSSYLHRIGNHHSCNLETTENESELSNTDDANCYTSNAEQDGLLSDCVWHDDTVTTSPQSLGGTASARYSRNPNVVCRCKVKSAHSKSDSFKQQVYDTCI
ncbi:hypothetical protein Ciccas_013262, partial [Cichlidogyrus casuarinus]